MIGGGWLHSLGFVAVFWLAASDIVDRAIPATMPALDVERLRAQVPDLVLADGRPDLAATARARPADPQHPLAQERLRDLGRLLVRLDAVRSGNLGSNGLDRLLREVPPDPAAAVDLLGAWYDAAEAARLAHRFPPPVRMSREVMAGFAERPLAERMVHPPGFTERSRFSAALVVETILSEKR